MSKFSKIQYVTPAFTMAIVAVLLVVIFSILLPDSFAQTVKEVRIMVGRDFGWYYLLLVTLIVAFCLFLIVSPIGQIRLGDPDSEPEHSTLSWIAMLFSAGMGIGLVFWGAAEPLSHFAVASPTSDVGTPEALRDAMRYTYFHWGIHAWAVYAIVALSLAYFKFRKKERSLLSVTLKPLFGNQADGFLGKTVDSLTIFATVIGVATTLGFGAVQINGGLHYLFGIPVNATVQLIIVAITTLLFILSAVSGIGKGVKILSNINVVLAAALLVVAILVGPSVLVMDTFVATIGYYLQHFFEMSFKTGALNPGQKSWISSWTIFYWAWWISWSPFVGVFIARISKGRTIREFLIYVLLVPTVFSFLWFATFGALATSAQIAGANLTALPTETILFGMFSQYPLGEILSIVAVALIFSFFITSADSATYVLGMLSENGNIHPHNTIKIIWGILVSAIALVLLMSGGLSALQNILIIVAFPFSAVIILMGISLYVELDHEQKAMGLRIRPQVYPEKDNPFRSYEE